MHLLDRTKLIWMLHKEKMKTSVVGTTFFTQILAAIFISLHKIVLRFYPKDEITWRIMENLTESPSIYLATTTGGRLLGDGLALKRKVGDYLI